MINKQELRSQRTRKSILAAAEKLFSARGFDAVTMREIAKEAGCSHTTIYIYYKDKVNLLYQLSLQPLEYLQRAFEDTMDQNDRVDNILKRVCHTFIEFCLINRNMYTIFFNAEASQVDEEQPELEINRLRNRLFGLLKAALRTCLQLESDDPQLLSYSRILFYTLQGIVGTYTFSAESYEQLIERLGGTFDEAIDVLLAGFRINLEEMGG